MTSTADLILKGSIQMHRLVNRDTACILWALFDGLDLEPHSYNRVKLLKMIAKEEPEAMRALSASISQVVQQFERIAPKERDPRSLPNRVRAYGLADATAHFQALIRLHISKVDGLARLLLLPIWAHYGFPSVQIGHRLVASLAVTRISTDVMASMELPWPAFCIELPDGVFTTSINSDTMPELHDFGFMLCGKLHAPFVSSGKASDGESAAKAFIEKDNMPQSYALIATSVPCALWSIRKTIAELGENLDRQNVGNVTDNDPDPVLRRLALPVDLVDSDSRTMAILTRVFASTVLMLTAGHFQATGKSHGYPAPATTSGNRRQCPIPVSRVFTLTAPIRHDFREAVGDYLRGGGSPPTVQGIVTGHWKMQPYGAGRAQRRLQFIEPYWRGPEDAPIAIRPTRLK